MLASNNVLFPANGDPSIVPSQDVVLGLYYTTRDKINGRGEGMTFADISEVIRAYENKEVELASRVNVRITEYELVDKDAEGDARFAPKITLQATTVGRAILSEILPKGLPFSVLNKPLKKKEISRLINTAFRRCGLRETVIFADKLLQSGFRLATRAGISIAIDDMLVRPRRKRSSPRLAKVKEYDKQYMSGLVTDQERYNTSWTSGAPPATRWARR